MADACREEISKWWKLGKTGENAGLLRDRYLRVAVKDKEKRHPGARRDLFEAMCESLIQSQEIYEAAYERRAFMFKDLKSKGFFSTAGRLVIGLGGENVLETGLTLNRTYGAPMIPGTALKGLASHYCHQAWGAVDDNDQFKLGGEYHRTIFGTPEDSGHIIFHDAWITPETMTKSLQPDVMTPHHGDYYSGESGSTPPTDFDDPKPVTFLSVVGNFHVVISCDVPGTEGQNWANLVFEMLSDALNDWGIGGKTNAGYGRLVRSDEGLATKISVKAVSDEQTSSKATEPQVRRPGYKKGAKIEVTREADPKQRNRAYFKADDGFGGFVQYGDAPYLDIGQKTSLEIAGVMDEGYVFAVPGSRDGHIRKKGKKGRRGRR